MCRFDEADIGDTRASLSARFFEAADEPTSASPPPPPPPPPPAAGATRANFPERRNKVKEGIPKKATEASPERGGRVAESAITGAGRTRGEGGARLTAEAEEATSEGTAATAATAAAAGAESSAGTAHAGEASAAAGGCGTAADDTAAPTSAGKRKVGAESGEERREGESPHKAAAAGSGGGASREGRRSIAEDCSHSRVDTGGTTAAAGAELKQEVNADGKGEKEGTQEGNSGEGRGGASKVEPTVTEGKEPRQATTSSTPSPMLAAVAETDEAVGSDDAGRPPSPYGISLGLAGAPRATPDYARKTWKAYHERQALLAGRRQYSRPVEVDPVVWGDLIGRKLAELIEGERNHPRSVVRGGAADRDGGHCLLPELDDIRLHSGHEQAVAAAVCKPKFLRFSAEGSEYTADDFGAGGGFDEMYQRFSALIKQVGGLAAKRARTRAGYPDDQVESHRESRSSEKTSREAEAIPWELGAARAAAPSTAAAAPGGGDGDDGGGGGGSGGPGGTIGGSEFGDDLFAGDAAAVLQRSAEQQENKNDGQLPDADLKAHPIPHIGPDSHRLLPDEVEAVLRGHAEESVDGYDASFAAQMQHRLRSLRSSKRGVWFCMWGLVSVGGGAEGMKKLRGTAARERRERARPGLKDRYLEEAVRRQERRSHIAPAKVERWRNHRAASDDYDDEDDDQNASTSCSVATFEDFYLKSTQAADALPVVEGRMNAEETKGASMEAPPPLAKVEEATIRKQQRREERRAERVARLELKREQARRGKTSLDGSSISADPPGGETSLDGGPPSGEILVLLPRRKIGGGGGGGGVGDPEDDASLDPSVSSLGTYDEHSLSGSSGAPRNLQSLEEPPSAKATGGGGGRLPAVLPLPSAADVAEEIRRRPRRRSRLADVPPTPPSPTAASVSTGGGVQSAVVSYSTGDVPTGSGVGLDGGALAERGRTLSRLGILFGGASKRRRSRGGGGGGSSIGASGAALAALGPAASGCSIGLQPLAPATVPAIGFDGNGTSSAGAAAAPTVALLKGKIKGWRRRKLSAAPTVPPPLSATLTPVVDDDRRLSRGSSCASTSPGALLPLVAMADGDSGGGGAPVARDIAPAAAAATRPPPMALIPVKVGTMDGERTLSDSPSAISSLAGSTQAALTSGSVDSGTVSRTVSGTPSLGSEAETSATAGSSATAMATAAPIAGGVPGMGQAGAGMDGGGGGGAAARGQHDGDQPKMTRKKRRSGRRSGADTGNTQRVHKINLGSKKDQMTMTHADRTALLIGACEWGDLEALQRLLELGASPLDLYSPSVEGSRCVFCQFFLFLLQVGAGLRSRLAMDDSLHDRALSMLIQPSLEKNRRFLSGPQLRDQDEGRGFCLVHHAAAFGNANKVEFLLQRGVDPDVRARGGDETALMVAARRGQRPHLEVAAALIKAGADKLARDRSGRTPLHHAASAGRKHMCHYLLLVGGDKTARDDEGRTPMDACRTGHPRAFAVMQSFISRRPPPATILDYMEKVEVHGHAQEVLLRQQAGAAAAAAASLVGGGEEEDSMASWDAASLGGMVSGTGAISSVLSLGSLVATTTTA
ncbi:unnamed protein product [Ectocarpus sp. CCAP 1310/34]|nr:unnamed protein product [Ectocarpus sp. CCAP 1310/34]